MRAARLLRPSLAFAALLLGGAARGAPADGAIRITGTGSAIGVIERLGHAFEKAHPGQRIQLLPSVGSSGAVRAVAGGALDLGLSGRALRPDEQALGVRAIAFARTPFILAVGPQTSATRIGLADLARIYRGEMERWPDGERVRAVLRPASDADTAYLRTLSPELGAAVDAAHARSGMLMAITNQECDEIIGRTPGSIGPSTLAQLRTDARGLRALWWEGIEPTVANMSAGIYPLAKPLYLVLPREPSPAARQLLAFLASPQGRSILEEAGCQPLPLPAAP